MLRSNSPEHSHAPHHARLAVTLAALAIVAALLPFGVSAGALNTAVLDNGTCGHNLQLGSDPTASSSATPWFLLYGDGAAASYSIAIDGVSIGTFTTSDMFGNVCISDTRVLAQGTHTLTGNELAPHATYTVTPFTFSVDSIPSAVPSAPVLSPASDTGVLGDNITTVRNPTLTGTAEPNIAIRVYNGLAGAGGARADSTGHWSVATVTMTDGVHTLTAASVDQAGNLSAKSAPLMLTIGSASPTVPGAPSLTSATAGNGQVSLAWTAPASNGGSAITGYRVYRSTSAGSETLYVSLGNVTSYTDVGLANGTTYYYKVAAVNSLGTGALSNERSATPVAPATVPGAPSLTSATAGNGQVSLAWTAPASNGGSAITGYTVTAAPGGATCSSAGLGCTVSGLANGTTYSFSVTATNSVGTGAASNSLSATPVAPATVPSAPQGVTAQPNKPRGVSLAWTAPASNGGSAITGYQVYRGTSAGTETLYLSIGNTTKYKDTGATGGTRYYYKVIAFNAMGLGTPSAEVSAVAR